MLAGSLIAVISPSVRSAPPRSRSPRAALLVTGLEGASGSTIGPGGALYVTEGAAGRIARVDPQTGEITTYASGLPKAIPAIGIGGAIDVAFIARPHTYWSPSSVLTSAAVTLTASTEWTAQTVSPSLRTLATS